MKRTLIKVGPGFGWPHTPSRSWVLHTKDFRRGPGREGVDTPSMAHGVKGERVTPVSVDWERPHRTPRRRNTCLVWTDEPRRIVPRVKKKRILKFWTSSIVAPKKKKGRTQMVSLFVTDSMVLVSRLSRGYESNYDFLVGSVNNVLKLKTFDRWRDTNVCTRQHPYIDVL